ncbi:nucleotide exchange factor GrpE [Halomicroarcula sp. GCM10025817]|uniref:nucleotide exchange factor GrpE n=1 Tax=Haloarcula TaxID=2237 RepID=UPI0023E8C6E6|nr:nucleotide exchange factor GrpE [Halomicroarcula sp. SYNS111]
MTEQDAADESAATESERTVDDVDIEEAPEDVDVSEVDIDGEDDAASGTPDEALVERVAESDPEGIASELAALRARTETLKDEVADSEAEIEELESKLKRKQADFQNFKKRMEKRREEEKQRATEDLVTRLFDVRDNLKRALDQDEDADIRDGVEATLRQLDDVLDAEGVEVIDPDPGSDVDPTQHQVLAKVDSDEDPGSIADVHRPGYEMGEKVLREAQVTVSEE